MKTRTALVFVFLVFASFAVFGQTKRDILDVDEILNQLGLCSANFTIEQKFTRALQAENAELHKKIAELEKEKGSK